MPDPRQDHGSGVVPVDDYQPGSRMLAPDGRSRGVAAIPAEHYPKPVETRRQAAKAEEHARSVHEPRRKGRPVGSRNRPPPTEDMFNGPPDPA